jgi:signal transduction histidine kinase
MIRDAIRLRDTGTEELVNACARLARQSTEELRTISYLLHPPLLNELGLGPALREFVEGFARRSGIQITLNINPELGRFEQQLELTVFRIMQEALSNIHRHANSRTAAVTLVRHSGFLHLEVADVGRGIPPEVLAGNGSVAAGVGLAAIRERLRLVGGHQDIRSGASGTIIDALMPVADVAMNKAAASGGDSVGGSPVPS